MGGKDMESSKRLFDLLEEVKLLAREYYELTGKPLGVTGEIAEYEAAQALRIELSPARQSGYDAIRKTPDGDLRLQIKGRRLTSASKSSQRIGSIDFEKEWDAVVLVLLGEEYEPTAIYEAARAAVVKALAKPGSKARNDRGQLSVREFKLIGRRVWPS